MASLIQVDTKPYVMAHQCEPRGFGNWWFSFLDNDVCYQAPYSRALAAAKREARQEYQKLGSNYSIRITVLP